MLNNDGISNVQRMYNEAKRKADEAKVSGDWQAWAIYATQASAIDTTAVMLGVFIHTGTGLIATCQLPKYSHS